MSRVINPDSAGKERNRLCRCIVLSLRELMKQQETDLKTKDLASYIAISLQEINETVDISVAAWEKRGYWVKADRFRMDWEWTGGIGKQMEIAILKQDWAKIAELAVQTGQKLNKIKVPEHNRLGTPWVGYWNALIEKQEK